MKKSLKLIPLILAASLTLAGCSDFSANWPMREPDPAEIEIDDEWVDYSVPFTSIEFGENQQSLSLSKGDTFDYTYTYEPRNANTRVLQWYSSKPSVATIDQNGHLEAVGGGETTITLSGTGISATSKVKVSVPLEDFDLDNSAITMDFEDTVRLPDPVFSPQDSTEKEIIYEVDDYLGNGIISVDQTGLITSGPNESQASSLASRVKVTSVALGKTIVIPVQVTDTWNYVKDLSLSIDKSEVEIGGSAQLTSVVEAVNGGRASTLDDGNYVVYSVEKDSEAFVSVSEDGLVTAKEAGEATIKASIRDSKNGKDFESTVKLTVFEVKATGIHLTETGPLELDNLENNTHKLSYTYSVDKEGYDTPSRSNVKYSSLDTQVVKVDDDGLISVVGLGSTEVKVTDTIYNVSDTIVVNTKIYAKSVSLVSSGQLYKDESVTITASVTPAKNSEELIWVYNEGKTEDNAEEYALFSVTESGNTITVKAISEGLFTVKAKIGNVTSNEIKYDVVERQIEFEPGKVYIVGSRSYRNGESEDAGAQGSWDVAKYAFEMKDKTGKDFAEYEYKATIKFEENDLWIIRGHRPSEEYNASYQQIGRYKVDEGAFAKGQMSVTSESLKSVRVKQAGTYDIYFAHYLKEDVAEGWYEVFVEEHGLKVSSESVKVKMGSHTTVTASNYEGTLTVSGIDENIATTALNVETGKITITPVSIGETSFNVSDKNKEINVAVEVVEGQSTPVVSYYVRGTVTGLGWDALDEYQLHESVDPNNLGELLNAHFGVGEFKIADASWSDGSIWGYEYDGHGTVIGGAASCFSAADADNNIKCNVEGDYNVYLTSNNYISIEKVGGGEDIPTNLTPYYLIGDVNNWAPLVEYQLVKNGDDKGALLNVALPVGDFKIATSDWSEQWGWDYDSHVTIVGSNNFELGDPEYNNIHCSVAGTYSFWLTQDNYIYVQQVDAGLSLDKISASINVGAEVSVNASNVEGALTVTGGNTEYATYVINDNVVTFTGVQLTTEPLVYTFGDDTEVTQTFTLNVSEISERTIYLHGNYRLFDNGCDVWVHAWDENGGMDYKMERISPNSMVYSAAINQAYDHVVFARVIEGATDLGENWTNVYNKTADLELPVDKDMWKMVGWTGENNETPYGDWELFDPNENYDYVELNALYVRGPATGATGREEEQWAVSDEFKLGPSSDENNRAEILGVYLQEGDFKIADADWSEGKIWGWNNLSDACGAYSSFSKPEENDNIHVDVAGKYDIYLTNNDYIYIEFSPVFSIDKESASIGIGKTVTVTASHVEGELHISGGDVNYATYEVEGNVVTFTGVAATSEELTYTFSDDSHEATFKLSVEDINYTTLYLHANQMFDVDCDVWVHAWDENGSMDYKMSKLSANSMVYTVEINEAYDHVIFCRVHKGASDLGEEWANVWNQTEGFELDGLHDMWKMTGWEDVAPVGEWETFDPNADYDIHNLTDIYVRGDATGATGTEEQKWAAQEAFKLVESSDPNNKGEITVYLEEGEFKLGNADWSNSWGYSNLNNTCAAYANFEDAEGNIKVLVAGYYTIYLTTSDEIYIVAFSIDKDSATVEMANTVDVTASFATGDLVVTGGDENFATYEINDNVITFTPVAVTSEDLVYTISDGHTNLTFTLKVVENIDHEGLYIRGDAGSGWDDLDVNYKLGPSEDDNNQGEILNVHLGVGDFKIGNYDWDPTYGWSNLAGGAAAGNFSEAESGYNNIHVDVAGYYNIYLTKSGQIYIEFAPVYSIDKESASIEVSQNVVVTVSNYTGTISVSGGDNSKATYVVDGNKVTFTGVAVVEDLEFTISDEASHNATFTLTVTEAIDHESLYIRGDATGATGSEEEQWAVQEEFKLGPSSDPNNQGEILNVHLVEGDFKIGNYDWSIEKTFGWSNFGGGGAAANFEDAEDENNIHVKVSGYYNIYLTNDGHIYVEFVPVYSIDKENATIEVGQNVVVTVSNYEGSISVSGGDNSKATYVVEGATVTFTGVAVVENLEFTISDEDSNSATFTLSVIAAIDHDGLYIRGDAGSGWDLDTDYKLVPSADPNNQGEILNVHLGVGDFKIGDYDWDIAYGWSNLEAGGGGAAANFEAGLENNNIYVKTAGYYNIYLTNDHKIFIEFVPTYSLDKDDASIEAHHTVEVNVSNSTGEIHVSGGDVNYATYVVEGTKVTFTGVAPTTSDLVYTISDDDSNSATFTLTVTEDLSLVYVRGDATGATGTEEEEWAAYNEFKLGPSSDEANAGEIIGVYLKEGDFKLGNYDWTSAWGFSELSSGSAAYASFEEGSKDNNIHVKVAGYYSIYLTKGGEIYIVAFAIDKDNATLEVGQNTTVTISFATGAITVSGGDNTKATYELVDNVITFTAVAVTGDDLVYTIFDGKSSKTFTLKVIAEIDHEGVYVRGDATSGWDVEDLDTDYKLSAGSGDDLYQILGVHLGVGDFKIGNYNWDPAYGWSEFGGGSAAANFSDAGEYNNIHCSTAGYYNIYINQYGQIFIEFVPVYSLDKDDASIEAGHSVDVNVANSTGVISVTGPAGYESYATVVVDGTKVTFTGVAPTTSDLEFTVSDEASHSATFVLTVTHDLSIIYVRGDATGATGTEEEQWAAQEAFKLGPSSDEANLGEIIGVYLEEGEFKLGNYDWTSSWGFSALNAGSAAYACFEDAEGNIKVLVAGYYSIYLTKGGEIYIVAFSIDKTSETLEVGQNVTVTVSFATGAITVSGGDNSKATFELVDNVITFTAVAVTGDDLVYTISDGKSSKTFTLKVIAAIDHVGLYIRGDAGSGWDLDTDYKLGTPADPEANIAEILNVHLVVGDFKIGDYDWDEAYGWSNFGGGGAAANFEAGLENNNIYVKVAGYYNIYLTKAGQIYVEFVPVYSIDKESATIEVGQNVVVTVSNYTGSITVTGDNSKATYDVDGNKVTFTGVAVGDSLEFTISDSASNSATFTLTVIAAIDHESLYIRGDATGTTGSEEEKWAVQEAYKLGTSSDPLNAGEILGVHLVVGDFKIGDYDWDEAYGWSEFGGGGAAANFEAGLENNNIDVKVAGYYNIYLTKAGQIYVEFVPVYSIDKESATIEVGQNVVVTVSNYTGSITVTGDNSKATYVVEGATVTFTGVATVENLEFTISDTASHNATFTLTVIAAIDHESLYIRGDATGATGSEEEKWAVQEAYKLGPSSDPLNAGEILNVHLGVGDFKIGDYDWDEAYGWSEFGGGGAAANFEKAEGEGNYNIHVKVAGYYNIYLTKAGQIYVEFVPVYSLDKDNASIEANHNVAVTVSNYTGEISVTGGNVSYATFEVVGNVITFTGVASTESDLVYTISDEASHSATFTLTVTHDLSVVYIRGDATGATGTEEEQWAAQEAFKLGPSANEANAGEIIGVYLEAGDFKLGNYDWTSAWGFSELNSGSVAYASFEAGSKDNNIHVKVAGYYSIYLTKAGEIFIVAMSIDKASANVEVSDTVNVTVSFATGAITVSGGDENFATYEINDNVITFTGVAATASDLTYTISDGKSNKTFTLTVTEAVETWTIYFQSKGYFNSGAENEAVYIYAWVEGSEPFVEIAAFPGYSMNWVEDDGSMKIFSFELDVTYTYVIIVKVVNGNPTYQTVNIQLSERGDNNCIWIGDSQPAYPSNLVEVYGWFTYPEA